MSGGAKTRHTPEECRLVCREANHENGLNNHEESSIAPTTAVACQSGDLIGGVGLQNPQLATRVITIILACREHHLNRPCGLRVE